ncbi:membrane protein insertase YidC 1 [Philodulcilactobacillus myokoensis]|uniref:Membrane protein insertase YidC 1 n=1 Tax=Philodulcilactobacillus myokoensis TaxID=2929573 RepID=A0A9W6B1P0_9LACO|nr:membrane protein insertase YidC [Philodulcilactobacillus myokoensis]GLB46768.1 membrane protein insertase YidC 1 [Philodulcilactobacillus myokoensis]
MKKIKHLGIITLLGSLALILSGCVRTDASGKPYGFTYHYLAVPGQNIMDWLAKFVGGYGWALIVLTVIVRMILLPIMVKQMKQSTTQQEKISLIKPQLNEIQKKQKQAKNQQEQMQLSQSMMQLYRQNGISMTGGIGCLPIIIQIPVFVALYNAIRFSPEVSHTIFMGISLGKSNILLAILAFLSYLLQGYLMLIGVPKDQRKQMKMMLFLSPLMIFIFTIKSPAGLGIYFFIGGIFACIQTLIINLYRPKIRAEVAKNSKNHPTNKVKIPDFNSESEKNSSENQSSEKVDIHKLNRERNKGKQNHH